jgi:hypothetical protein
MKDFAEMMRNALTVELCLKEHGHPVLAVSLFEADLMN